jgi:hypothetical protein
MTRPTAVSLPPRAHLTAIFACVLGLLAAACGGTNVAPAFSQSASQAVASPSTSPSSSSSTASASPSPSPSAALGPIGSPDPANFTATIDNPWLPFVVGTTLTYRGTKDDERAVDIVTVTNETIVIQGVTCRVIRDRLYLSGKLEEKTADYYTQDLAGNVWYFGEDTEELDANGKVTSREGTWRAGVDGAMAGVFMEANPVVGHQFVQELYTGHAEDHFQVISLAAYVKVPYGSFRNVLQTKEWTPLEPAVIDSKYYVQGIGEVREASVKGPLEELALVKVEKP